MSDTETNTAENLKEKALNGFKWTFLDNVGRLGGQFIIGIVLARILTPEDFGLIGMLTIFIVIGRSLTNSGFGQALIQKQNADRIDFSTVFYFNIFTSIIIYLIIFVGSPLIAKFYREPQLVLLTKILCLEFILNAFSLIHTTYLQKNLKFKAPSIIGIISVVISGATSIVLALKGIGVWALVTNTVLQSLITTVLLWKVSKWRPLPIFSIKSLKSLFAYGSKILVAGILNSVFKNIYFLVIGRFFQAESLGYYTRANQFTNLPLNTITLVITKVTYPVFSSIQDDIPKLTIGYTKSIRMLSAVALPLMGIMYIIARPIIMIVLGDKWLPVVPYWQIMCLYSWIYVVYTINNLIITAKGYSGYYLRIQITNKILIVLSILVTYRYGITTMIYGHMAATIVTYIIGSLYLKKIMNISIFYQIKNILPFIISAGFIIVSSLPLNRMHLNEYGTLISNLATGTMVYIFFLWLFRVDELKQGVKGMLNMKNTIRTKFNK